MLGKCGICKRYMKIVEQAAKMRCDHCDKDYKVPSNGKFKIIGE